ncbi:archaeal proteasome endopeptidase complex subunit alpha [Candidatus Woesearchaeota archaeon]|nr:archaeal proteasome endopeptidase complex subunit alpha [Candidatus Woesearchaeota archaeon]
MQQVQHQMMGYDRAITMFSPDGRLLQVEYAKKTVKQGSTAIGIATNHGVVLVSDKRIVDPLVIPESVDKIFQIDEHIGTTASGILSDARVLVERAQMKAQQHQVTYDSPIDTDEIVKDIANLKQICTQSGGLRPFGVALLIAGVDEQGPRLYETDPTGIFFQFRAAAIGEFETEVEEILKKEYKETMSVDDAIKLGIKALVKVIGKSIGADRIDAAYIKAEEKKFIRLEKKEIEKIMNVYKKG